MKTIYYCHDEQTNYRPRCHDLEMVGYDVQLASSSGELKRLMARRKPDLVLLDVLLEGEDGFSVCRNLHLSKTPVPPVILFAGVYSRAGFRDEALRLGASAYLASDISRPSFLGAIAKCLEGDAKSAA